MRLTLDVDDKSKRKAMGLHKLLEALYPGNLVELWESSRRKGFHHIVHNVSGSKEDLICQRKFLGDDPMRIFIDRLRRSEGIPTDILFTEKGECTAQRII